LFIALIQVRKLEYRAVNKSRTEANIPIRIRPRVVAVQRRNSRIRSVVPIRAAQGDKAAGITD